MRYEPHYVIDDPREGINITRHAGCMQVIGQLVDHCEKRMSQRESLRVGEPDVVARLARYLEGDGAYSTAPVAAEMRRANSVTP